MFPISSSSATTVSLILLALPPLSNATGIDLWVPETDSARLSFSLGTEHQAELQVDSSGVAVTVDGGESETLLEEPMPFQEEILVSIADYNFDGYSDVGVLESHGYGGVNLFTAVYVYQPQNQRFSPWLTESNIWLDPEAREIHTSQKSGPLHYVTVYRIHEGAPYAHQESALVAMDLEKITLRDPAGNVVETRIVDLQNESAPALRTIGTERAYFHAGPDEATRSETYIVQGDQVELLDSAGEFGEWFRVRYRGSKVYERWIRGESIAQ